MEDDEKKEEDEEGRRNFEGGEWRGQEAWNCAIVPEVNVAIQGLGFPIVALNAPNGHCRASRRQTTHSPASSILCLAYTL